MEKETGLDREGRVVFNPAVCHGHPVVRGTRVMVWLVLEYLANGDSVDDVLAAHPALAREDVSACLAYASRAARERIVPVEAPANAF
jgi:uncharacterized protein (DUF433 family)